MSTKYENNINESFESFEDMVKSEDVLRGIYAKGFEFPSNIQQSMILPFLEGRDILCHAKSGTGKTAGFCIPILEKLISTYNFKTERVPRALIVSPVRELSQQTYNVLNELGQFCDDLKVVECVGGTKVRDNIQNLKNGCQIVCGTPGRINDMIDKKILNQRDLDIIVLDEADELLKKNFKTQIYQILDGCKDDLQVCLYSATMPVEVIEIAEQFLRDPAVCLLDEDDLTLEGIRQFYVNCERDEFKFDTLLDLYSALNCSKAFIFVNENSRAASLAERLSEKNFTPSVIMGTMMQDERNTVLKEFRYGKTNLLVSSDLLARGIDIQGVDLVINYDFPTDRENYIHRIGRSGRYGRKGVAINFITDNDLKLLKETEEFYHTKIDDLPYDLDDLFN